MNLEALSNEDLTALKDKVIAALAQHMTRITARKLLRLWQALEAHDWFVLPLSMDVYREYHRGAKTWERKYGTYADPLLAFLASKGLEPGEFMLAGTEWFRRVLVRLAELQALVAIGRPAR
ncbi:hypothetical protein C2U70_23870 [Bradyrhizobium guangdongense]|uniref:DUF968 domain-containing protein n=1 Tax=Bradyrhizobium guangdongense TaxID=1325090 RepID=UPI001127EB36|nr:DUF968 domain-containing protein [Bradyrhizobium guangdongense]TPQ31539.1 hypothetical protein C2U70_23870 [Bradyrhizobium guangdongense]